MSTALHRKAVTSSLCHVTMLTITSSEYSNDRHLIYSLQNIAKEVKFVYYSLELQIIVLPVQFKPILRAPDKTTHFVTAHGRLTPSCYSVLLGTCG